MTFERSIALVGAEVDGTKNSDSVAALLVSKARLALTSSEAGSAIAVQVVLAERSEFCRVLEAISPLEMSLPNL